ncbi:21838_t:CDS:2, partial [Gigaspora rosea]
LKSKITKESGNPDLELIADSYKGKLQENPRCTRCYGPLMDPREILNYIKEQHAELYAAKCVDWSIIEKLTGDLKQATEEDTKNLLVKITEQKLTGIPIKDLRFKITAYANNLTVEIALQAEWSILNSLIRSYEAVSNAKINLFKSVLVPLTMNAKRFEEEETRKFKTVKKNESITILEYRLNKKGKLE